MVRLKPTQQMVEQINQMHGTNFTVDDIDVHETLLVGSEMVTDRFLMFHPDTLKKYAQTLSTAPGIPEKFNHSRTSALVARSFGGEIRNEQGTTIRAQGDKLIRGTGETTNLYGRFYIARGITMADGSPYATTDDIIKAIDTRTVADTSVEVYFDRLECSICGNDIRDWENCNHWPGMVFKRDEVPLLCYVTAMGGDILSNAFVDAGAYHAAGVSPRFERGSSDAPIMVHNLKLLPQEAQVFGHFSKHGMELFVAGENARVVHDRLHAAYGESTEKPQIAALHKSVVMTMIDQGQEHQMADALDGNLPEKLKRLSKERDRVTEEEAKKLTEANAELSRERDALRAEVEKLKGELQAAKDEAASLMPFAEDGKAYRKDLIAQALASGVRAYGNAFPSEHWEKVFAAQTLEEIKTQAEAFEAIAKETLKAGRVSGIVREQRSDDSVYKVR